MFTKHIIALVALSLFVSFTAHAITWTGAANSAWGNQDNWDEFRVPNENDDVIIPNTEKKPTILFDAKAKSIYLEPGAELIVMSTKKLTIKGGGAFGIKNYGEITNTGEITISTEEVTAGIENYGYIFNRNKIVINRAAQYGIYNYSGGTFDNNGDLNITTNEVVDGVINFGTFDNKGDGSMLLDKIIRYCIDNQASGEFNNNGKITFPGNSHVNNGLNNAAVFNNESTGELLFEQGGLDAVVNYSNGTLNNRGKIKIGTVGSYNDGIANTGGAINNFENGEIHIDRTDNVGIGQSSGTFLNEGTITIGAAASVGTYGILNGMFAGFENKTSGEISINNTSNAGLYAFGLFENEGSVVIEAATGGHAFEGALQNAGCATMHVSNALNIYFENEGYLWVNTDKAHSIIGNNPAINNGVIVYPQGNPIPNVTNNDLIVLPIAGECSIANALQIGPDNDHLPSATWYKDANFTQIAGSYDAQTNTFEAQGLTDGTQTLYIGVTPLVGFCWYPTPIAFTFDDVTKPSIICPANQTVEGCSGNLGAWNPIVLGDNCTPNPAVTQTPPANTPFSGPNDSKQVTLLADDGNGNTRSCAFTVTMKDLTPPVIVCPANATVAANANCAGTIGSWSPVSVEDNCAANPAVTQSPAVYTALNGHGDTETVTLTANDGYGNTQACSFVVTLQDVYKPIVQCPTNQILVAGSDCSATLGAWTMAVLYDNCTATNDIVVTQSPAANTILNGHNDAETVTLTATDANGNSENCSFTVTLKDQTKPVIVCPANTTVAANAECGGTVGSWNPLSVGDNCAANPAVTQTPAANTILSGHNDLKTITLTANDGNGNTQACSFTVTLKDQTKPVIVCPTNKIVNAGATNCSGTVGSWAPVSVADNCAANPAVVQTPAANTVLSGHNDIETVTLTANDGNGNTQNCQFTVTLKDVTQPVFTSIPANVTVQCSAVPAVGNATASDNCGTTVAYSGQTISNTTCTDSYVITRQWTATDAAGNTRTATQRIVVQDTQKPNFTSTPANLTVQCDAVPAPVAPAATDNCDAAVAVTYNGQTQTNGACPNAYTLTRRWTAADNCGNTKTVTQRIVVVDNGKPVFTAFPANSTIACHENPPAVGTPTASDGCGGNVTVTYMGQSTTSGNCPGNYQIKRTWRATDACGNSTVATQTIQVVDNNEPVFTSAPADVTIQCGQPMPPLVNPTASDACGYAFVTFLGNVPSGSGCSADYIVTRSWEAEDLCGNTASVSQVITVLGNNNAEEEGAESRENGATEFITYRSSLPVTPNPTSDRIWVDLSEFAGEAVTVSIFSDMGQLVWENSISEVETAKISVSLREAGAAAGIYTVSVRGAGEVVAKRVVLVE